MAPYTPPAGLPDTNLVRERAARIAELQDPATAARFYSNFVTEVGDLSKEEQQAYVETVLNRGAARNKTLMQTVSDRGYYPGVSLSNVNVSAKQRAAADAALNAVAAGGNISGYATGNESGGVRSGGANIAYMPRGMRGERFVHENADLAWIRRQQAAGQNQSAVAATGAPYFLSAQRAMQFGGIVRGATSALLGEHGAEAVIPMGGGPRAQGMLGFVNRMMGGGGIGGHTLHFTPNITINGNMDDKAQRSMDSMLRDLAKYFISQFARAQGHERRLSFESGYG